MVEYDRCRDEAANELGIRVVTLDKEIAKRRPKQENEDESGAKVLFKETELWPQPVDGTELLDKLTAGYKRFLALPECSAEAMALWTVHAHAHDDSHISPILAFVSPEKRCGKTTALDLLNRTTPRPLPASNITSAVLFRSVEKWRPTMLIDEADTFLKGNEELRGVFNSGHNRSQAFVIRTSGDDYEPRVYSTWSPKVIAMIGSLPGTLEDRAIAIKMRRKRHDEGVDSLRGDQDYDLRDLARQCARWVKDNSECLRESDPGLPKALHDRACDNWRALLAIADLAGGEWPQTARKAAEGLTAIEDESSIGTLLLADIRDILIERGRPERISSTDLCEALLVLPDRPWPEITKGGKPLTPPGLSRRLRPFEIRPAQRRIGNTNAKGYASEDFAEAFERYLSPDPTDTSAQTETSKQVNEIDELVHAETETASVECFGLEFPKPPISNDCFYVSIGNQVVGEDEPGEWGESECFASTIQKPNEIGSPLGVMSGELATCDRGDSESDDWESEMANWDSERNGAGKDKPLANPYSCSQKNEKNKKDSRDESDDWIATAAEALKRQGHTL